MACISSGSLGQKFPSKQCTSSCTEVKGEDKLLLVDRNNPITPSASSTETKQANVLFGNEKSTEKDVVNGTGTNVTSNINRYFDSEPLSVSTVPDAILLLQAAENLMLSELANICLEFILQNVDKNDALHVYHYLKQYPGCNTDSHEDENLRNELLITCLQIIDVHAENLLQSKDFVDLDTESVKDIISRTTLKLSRRQSLLEALDKWASHNCKCCHLLNDGEIPILGEKVTCSHRIVPKNPPLHCTPLKTINIDKNMADTVAQNNQCYSFIDKTQVKTYMASVKSENRSDATCVLKRNSTVSKRRMSASQKVLHGLNDILGFAIKIFD